MATEQNERTIEMLMLLLLVFFSCNNLKKEKGVVKLKLLPKVTKVNAKTSYGVKKVEKENFGIKMVNRKLKD